jgi:hypothetical protein
MSSIKGSRIYGISTVPIQRIEHRDNKGSPNPAMRHSTVRAGNLYQLAAWFLFAAGNRRRE